MKRVVGVCHDVALVALRADDDPHPVVDVTFDLAVDKPLMEALAPPLFQGLKHVGYHFYEDTDLFRRVTDPFFATAQLFL